MASLVEIQVGVITASMPAFARMLHHHLPPWKQLKSRFSFRKSSSQTESSKRSWPTLVKGSAAAKTRLEEKKMPYNSRTPFVDIERSAAEGNGAISGPHFEMDNLKSVKTYIKGGQRGNVDEDGIYLKHDLERTWSSIDSTNAIGNDERWVLFGFLLGIWEWRGGTFGLSALKAHFQELYLSIRFGFWLVSV